MNYDEIKQAVRDFSDRTDIDGMLDLFIKLTESRMNRALRVREMASRSKVITVADQEYYGLPPNFAGIRDIEIRDTTAVKGETGVYLSPEQMNNCVATGGLNYTIVADQLQIYPTYDNRVLEIIYYKKLDSLNENNTVNWLSDSYPDAYIFGVLIEVESYVKNAEGAMLWQERFRPVMDEITASDATDRWSGSAMTIKVG